MSTSPSELLREALKRKGIGPKGSKKLPPDLLQAVLPLLSDTKTNRTTAATFWTACLLLEKSEEEEQLLLPILQNPEQHLLPELQALTAFKVEQGVLGEFLKLIHLVIEKQNLAHSDAQHAMECFWNPNIPGWMKGVFLQAERLKRESFEENYVFFDSLWLQSDRLEVDLPCVIDLCDSYDGTNRSYHLTPFIAAILGALGFPAIVHGVESLSPKYGITTSQILQNAGKSTNLFLEQAKSNLLNPDVGWCYVDQSVFFPKLHAMSQLRHDMVKRPFLATFEKLLQPIHNRNGNIVFAGYVHAHYRAEVVKLLSLHNHSDMAFNLRTIEGSTNCWGKKPTPFIGYRTRKNHGVEEKSIPTFQEVSNLSLKEFFSRQGKELIEGELLPEDFGIQRNDHKLIKGITTEQVSQAGIAALQEKEGLIHDLLVYQTAAFLWLSGLVNDKKEAVERAEEALHSGKAWQHWQNHD